MNNMRRVFAAGLAAAGVISTQAVFAAEDGTKVLPTLLIKGEVVSLDGSDPAASLLKVKDRYGFETPIFLTSETKVAKGAETVAAASLAPGTKVEVEYNFDVNTAKRHAVSVKVASAEAPQASIAPTGSSDVAPASSAASAAPQAEEQPAAAASDAAVPAPEAAPTTP